MRDRLFSLRLFIRAARLRSLSAAGRELGVPQPSASRMMAALEREVGAALLSRTARAVALTDAGRDYLACVEPILDALEEADLAARGTGELRGALRIGATASFAVREIIPRLEAFIQRHPALRIELKLQDERADLLAEGVDVALRFGDMADTQMLARVIARYPRLLAASPAYLAERPAPEGPEGLADHLLIVGATGTGPAAWSFRRDGEARVVRVEPHLVVTTTEGATAAAAAGLGVISTGWAACAAELADGRLVRLLPGWRIGVADLRAVFPPGGQPKPAARAFADWLQKVLRDHLPPEEASGADHARGG